MRKSNKIFTGDEYQLRLGIFMTNQRLVREHNSNPKNTYKIGLNKLAAMTPSEYRSLLGDRPATESVPSPNKIPAANDAEVDWRTKGIVNAIKDQGQCGSCWAFGAIQAIESREAQKSGKLYRFSEQNLVDCATTCNGCGGGLASLAYEYIIDTQKGRVMFEDDYPYVAAEQSCSFDTSKAFDLGMSTYGKVAQNSEEDLASKCASIGVMEVSIDASGYGFHLYTGGIYDDSSCSSTALNHAVGCVGYGSENGVKYWIIRNSWGEDWGEAGYIRMVKDKGNQCGEATRAVYPIF